MRHAKVFSMLRMTDVHAVLGMVQEYWLILGVIVFALIVGAATARCIAMRTEERQRHEFAAYEALIRQLARPESGQPLPLVDLRMAVVFELRHYPRYYPVSLRILEGLRPSAWKHADARLIAEMDRTIAFLRGKSSANPWGDVPLFMNA